MKIWVQSLVKNEARFVWYSVMSVIEHIDYLLLWDTGSTDGTIEILKEIKESYPHKVSLKLLSDVTVEEFSAVRQQMLDVTKSDWFLVLDGDEVWWEDSIKAVINAIYKRGKKLESIVVPTINLVGDIYHYQEKAAGLYKLAGRKGHLNLRAVNRKIPGLSSARPHGTWGWVDENGQMIQNRDRKGIVFIDAPYLHASFLARAGQLEANKKVPKRAQKLKHEMGISFPKDFYYPEVFFRKRPQIVSSVWQKMDWLFYVQSLIETPLKKVKRRVLPSKIGY